MTMPTLLDIAKSNAATDGVLELIDEASAPVPEISMGAARTIKGTHYSTLVRTSLPMVGFRAANEGYAAGKSTYENRLYNCYIFAPRWECDKAVADACEDGAPAFIAMEADAIMQAAMKALGSQFYYGVSNDAKGFPGLLASYDSTNMVVDAGGTTDTTCSSLWAVRFGPQDVQWLWGQGGELNLSDVSVQRVLDGSSNPYDAYVQSMLARPGLKVSSIYSVGRIKKLTEDSGKGLTDARIAALLAKFPVGKAPTHLFCNRRSLEQLRASRTATNATGAPAPIPTEAFGIPLLVTDSIVSTEALTS